MKKSNLMALVLFIFCLTILSEPLLTRDNSVIAFNTELFPETGVRYYLNAERIDKSITRSIDVGFCLNYYDSAGKTRNRQYYVSSGDKRHQWEIYVREKMSVYSIESLRLTESTHQWIIWISESRSETSSTPDETVKADKNEEPDEFFSRMTAMERYRIMAEDYIGFAETNDPVRLENILIERNQKAGDDGPVTNIIYKSMDKRIAEIRNESSDRDWDREGRINFYKNYAKGGVLLLYVRRSEEWRTQEEHFSVLVMDGSERPVAKVRTDDGYPPAFPALSWDRTFFHNYILFWIPVSFNTSRSSITLKDGRWIQEFHGGSSFGIEIRDDASETTYVFSISEVSSEQG